MMWHMRDLAAWLIDLDGVVYRGDRLCPGAAEFVRWLGEQGRKYLFLTNSSAGGRAQVAAKLTRLGIPCEARGVLGAGEAAVQALARRFPGGGVYLVGERPIEELLAAHGLRLVNGSGARADVVLCCIDRGFDYAKLAGAVRAIEQGAAFVAANRDARLPQPTGVLPACGAMVAAIEACCGFAPEIIGKPEPGLFLEAMRQLGCAPQDTVMIGDNLHADVLGARRAGIASVLLLSGVTRREDLARAPVRPDAVADDLAALLEACRA